MSHAGLDFRRGTACGPGVAILAGLPEAGMRA